MEAPLIFQLQGKPISLNAAFQGRRFKTRDCKSYEESVFIQMRPLRKVLGWVEVSFIFYLKSFALSDLSNLVKILEDCIVKAGYIEDDRKIVIMHLEKRKSDNERVEVQIKQHALIDYKTIKP